MLDRVIDNFGMQIQSMNEVEDSFSSTVYKCKLVNSQTVFFKIPYSKLKYQRELEAYRILSGKVAVPELLDFWSGDDECPGAFLLSELKGSPLTAEVSPNVAYDVGVLHASMHNIQPPDKHMLTGIKNEFPSWTSFLENQFYSFAEDVEGVMDKHTYNLAIKKFEKMKRQLPSPDGPSFIHMDFRPANIIVDGEEVSGIIDFESVRFGSTEIDFTKLYRDFLQFDDSIYKAFQEGYNSIRPLMDLGSVLPFYRFTDAFNSIGWCKRRGTEKNALFLEENIRLLKQFVL
ncbi:phosphotransferase family protein [Oceanobacillus manasiensis]|uniref:phosphotransferase family protein n=1 Tax=Oceanobacillus manasiensis TaxID=586413 RepID=UPI0009FF0842|nr:aminoglycoside phosphotransferase family protein [Oceanobacillus manasiensis]